ncbi:transcriptional regulator [Caldicellulosiruptor bescii]|nr:transcriptional regulator [Caldicellulosiruptor bescii]
MSTKGYIEAKKERSNGRPKTRWYITPLGLKKLESSNIDFAS